LERFEGLASLEGERVEWLPRTEPAVAESKDDCKINCSSLDTGDIDLRFLFNIAPFDLDNVCCEMGSGESAGKRVRETLVSNDSGGVTTIFGIRAGPT
jgi:hypothetical protein